MKKYRVKINGKVYEVELEAVEENSAHIEVNNNTASNANSTNVTSTGSNSILAPIAGKVLDFKVNVGDRVKKGQVVAVIEAMKLENEIVSSFDGVVKEIRASKGANVENKSVLIVLG